MDPRLLEYYNRELSYLRETGAEFAARHPKVAARLGMQGTDIADPYVERMVEAFSFLSARTQLKIDAEFPRFTQRLLEGPPQDNAHVLYRMMPVHLQIALAVHIDVASFVGGAAVERKARNLQL